MSDRQDNEGLYSRVWEGKAASCNFKFGLLARKVVGAEGMQFLDVSVTVGDYKADKWYGIGLQEVPPKVRKIISSFLKRKCGIF